MKPLYCRLTSLPIGITIILMNELQRQAYLRAMGIEVVYPRLPVTAARPSPDYDLPAVLPATPGSGQQVASAADTATEAAGSTRARVVSELASGGSEARSGKRRAVSSVPAAANTPAQSGATGSDADAALRFRLHYLPVNAALSVLWEVPLHAASDQERESLILLGNILLALAAPLPAATPPVETFDWPIIDAGSEMQAGVRQAGQAVEGFMAMRRRRDGFTNLLVFASQVASILPGQGEHSDHRLDKLDCHQTCVSSLQAMLSVPAIKKDVWQQLQPLRQRLTARTH